MKELNRTEITLKGSKLVKSGEQVFQYIMPFGYISVPRSILAINVAIFDAAFEHKAAAPGVPKEGELGAALAAKHHPRVSDSAQNMAFAA